MRRNCPWNRAATVRERWAALRWLVLCGLAFLGLFATAAPLRAEEFQDAGEIRETTETILASPEFRHLRRQAEDDASPNVSRSSDSEGGGGSTGDGSGRGESGKTDAKSESRPDAGDSSQSAGDDAEESGGFQIPSMAGGLANAIGIVFHMLAWICLGIVCGLIMFLVAKALLTYEWPTGGREFSDGGMQALEETADVSPGELPADVYLAQAHELAAQGRYREATAQLLLGAMSHIERSGLIRYRRGLTYRDYLRAVRRDDRSREAFRGMVRIYEPLGFGRREPRAEHFEQSLAHYETGFRQTEPALEH